MTSMNDKFFIDTNILVYAHDTEDTVKQQKAQAVIFEGIRSEKAVISTQVISEFYVIITKKIKSPLPRSKAKEEIKYLSILEMVEIDLTLIFQALNHQDEWKISYWDALILASAGRAKCPKVLSEDFNHQHKYGDIVVENPLLDRF